MMNTGRSSGASVKKHDCVDDKPETEKEDSKAFQKLLHPATFYLISLWKATAFPRILI